jgi:hypothetical protein
VGTGPSGQTGPTGPVAGLYLLEAYSTANYTMPGGYTGDICRYNIVNNTVNVTSSWFDTSAYRFTPQRAGYWEITASYDVFRSSEASIGIMKNGTSVARVSSISAVVIQVTKLIYLNGSTDYITIYNLGGNSNARGQDNEKAWFQARWIAQ